MVWINEIHYDNEGTDTGEFIEIAGVAGTDLTGWSLVFYDGSTGTPYNTVGFGSLTLDDEGAGYGAVSVALPANGLQNGAPDGIALVSTVGVIEFISYEGSFTAVGGPADGLTSTDIGVSETPTTAVGQSLQLTGTGEQSSDFTWTGPTPESPGELNTGQTVFCFAAGTLIATHGTEVPVEDLQVGDMVLTAEGRPVPVKWVGRQTVRKLFAGPNIYPVRIRAGALGDGLPHSDLTVTADHGMIVEGLVINASALVNSGSIDWVPMVELPDCVTYYHIETKHHDVILANGAPAETFIDYAGRQAFDNYQEYVDLFGAERIIQEIPKPRISAQRLMPKEIKARLGVVDEAIGFNHLLRA